MQAKIFHDNQFFLSYGSYINELIKLAERHKIGYKIIGYETFEKIKMRYPIFRFLVNPGKKKRFCLVSGVQAYEIAGPLTFIELFQNQKKFFSEEIEYKIFPVINPTSFDLKQRNDDDGKDLNTINSRILQSDAYKEVQYFVKDIKNDEFDVFLSMHEDVDERRFYAYIFEKKKEPVYREMVNNISKSCPIWEDKTIYGDKSDGHGLLINHHDQSFEDRLFCQGQAKISLCTETPGKLSIRKRVLMNIGNIELFNRYILK